MPPIVPCQNLPPKRLGGRDFWGRSFDFRPDFLEIGELWSTFLTFSESPKVGLQRIQIWWAYVQKQKSWGPEYITAPSAHNALDARVPNHKIKVDPIILLNTWRDSEPRIVEPMSSPAHRPSCQVIPRPVCPRRMSYWAVTSLPGAVKWQFSHV